MDILDSFLLLLTGFFSGVIGMIVGAGGGFIFVPALLLLFDIPPKIAAGTGLAIVWINSISGIYGYIKQKRIDYKLGVILSVGALPGTFLGIWLTGIVTSTAFYIVFALMLIGLGIFMLFAKEPTSNFDEEPPMYEVSAGIEDYDVTGKRRILYEVLFSKSTGYILLTGILLGIVSTFFGIGGGWLLVPILIYLYRILPHTATATSIFTLCLYTSLGFLLNIVYQNIDWTIVLFGGSGIILGAFVGVFISKRISGSVIIKLLSVILLVMGVRLLLGSY